MKLRGFASVELVVVLVVSMLLLSAAAVKGAEFLQEGRSARAHTDTAELGALISQYRFEIGSYPSSLQVLTKKNGQFGPWIRNIPVDPWGQAYLYQSDVNGFAVWSKGKDRRSNSNAAKISQGDIGFLGK